MLTMERQNLALNRQDLPRWDCWGTSRVRQLELNSVLLKDDLAYNTGMCIKPSGKGEHLIVLRANGKHGWIPG